MTLTDGSVVLRDFRAEDIKKRIYWETEMTEWQFWDAPWEYEGLSEEQKAENLKKYVAHMTEQAAKLAALPDTSARSGFQLCEADGSYIGWCGSYLIDEECNFSDSGSLRAVGIDIPEVSARGKGCASRALILFIDYLTECGCGKLFTQTWSGNLRMISLARKLGFEEYLRKPGIRRVRGETYDGLTLLLNPGKYLSAKRDIL